MLLLLILNEEDDLVYEHAFNESDTTLYNDLLVVGYGAIDVINDLIHSNISNYYDCIETYKEYRVSVLIFPSFYKCMVISKGDKHTRKFISEIYRLIRELLIYGVSDDVCSVEEDIFKIHNEIYGK